MHIDFGFLFTTSPGNINFENAPFKLTRDYVNLIGGEESHFFFFFKTLILNGLIALRKNIGEIMALVEIMSYKSRLPCFEKFDMKIFLDRFKIDYT